MNQILKANTVINLTGRSSDELLLLMDLLQQHATDPDAKYPIIMTLKQRTTVLNNSTDATCFRQGFIMGRLALLVDLIDEPWEDPYPPTEN